MAVPAGGAYHLPGDRGGYGGGGDTLWPSSRTPVRTLVKPSAFRCRTRTITRTAGVVDPYQKEGRGVQSPIPINGIGMSQTPGPRCESRPILSGDLDL